MKYAYLYTLSIDISGTVPHHRNLIFYFVRRPYHTIRIHNTQVPWHILKVCLKLSEGLFEAFL